MKNTIFLLACIFGIVCPVFSLDLVGTTWGPERGGHGYYLKFTTDKDFEFIYSGEGGGQSVIGLYAHDADNLILNIITINDWGELPGYIKQKTINCSIVSANSFFSQYKLIGSGGMELWSINHKPENNEKITFGGNTFYVYHTKGKVNENARLREGPGLQYRYYTFSLEDESVILTALPKGSTIEIFGYSEIATTVDGVEKQWYYCSFRKNMWEEQFGWIWGGLIDF